MPSKQMSPDHGSDLAPLSVTGTMLTHTGYVRDGNEDTVAYVLPEADSPVADRGMLAVVADGMGGHAAGEVASRIAVETIRRLYYQLPGSPVDVLKRCMETANDAILAHSRVETSCVGMGTTCSVLAIRGNTAFVAHIGDSRVYMLRDGELIQISRDHSLVAEMVRDGTMTVEEAAHSPQRHVILRALGTQEVAQPAFTKKGISIEPGDVFVLCSDGLTDLVDDETIRDTVAALSPFEGCQALLDAALAAGGVDNISVGVFSVGFVEASPAKTASTRPLPRPVT